LQDVACIVNNTTIAETLGQIQVVLSDKTGTLTDNEMILRKLCIRDELYGEHADLFEDVQLRSRVSADDIHIVRFLESLVVCSTVLPSSRDSLKFEGSSPDEEALVNAAARLGLILSNRNEQLSTIKSAATQTLRNWNTLHALPFSSDRRRMTVLVRDDNGLLFLISKGADEALLPRLRNGVSDSSDDRSGSDAARRVLLQYARSGLRTLVVVRRPMTEFEFQQFESQLQSAQVSIHHRDAEVAAVFDRFERDYELIGLTGIEDKLQQDVPQTIQSIRQAGMAFWMLTGDKTETAIQIARSCNVISTFHKSTSSSSSSSDDEHVLQIVGASSVDVRLVLQRHLAFLSELESPTRTRNVNSNDPSRWWTRWWPYNSPTCSADSCVDAQFPCASAVVAVQVTF
jgi:phospholipid-translocating ATPase